MTPKWLFWNNSNFSIFFEKYLPLMLVSALRWWWLTAFSDMEEACSRGLDNLGRVYARKGDYNQAITVWVHTETASHSQQLTLILKSDHCKVRIMLCQNTYNVANTIDIRRGIYLKTNNFFLLHYFFIHLNFVDGRKSYHYPSQLWRAHGYITRLAGVI